jgi:hypothetical protein
LLTLAWNVQHLTSVDYNLYSVSVCKDSFKLQPNLHSLMGNEQGCVSSFFCWTEETAVVFLILHNMATQLDNVNRLEKGASSQ